MDEFQTKQQQLEKEQEKNKREVKHCKKCGATLSQDDKFCPECGEKIDGENKACRWCGTLTTKEICPECGKRVIPQICLKCGKETYFDICEHCGAILNPQLQKFAAQKQEPVKQMSQSEAEKIVQEFEEIESAELQHFRDKMKEHEILLAEKKFFDEREKRINDTFGENNTAIKYPDPEETKFLQEAAAGIKKSALKKEKRLIQEALEEIIPGAKSEEEEHEKLLKLIKEREELFNESVSENAEKLNIEIAAAEERKRKELEELQRRIEEQRKREEAIEKERRRLEIEAFNNRIRGTYICPAYMGHGEELRLTLSVDGSGKLTGKCITTEINRTDKYQGTVLIHKLRGNFDGQNLEFEDYEMCFISNPNGLDASDYMHKFAGSINSDGTVIHGYWFNAERANSYFDYRKY